jgi:hypothetical protein
MISIFFFLLVFVLILSVLAAIIPYINYVPETQRVMLKAKRPKGW